ncbi:TAXI family TRAP transporter solute-binding subunit [Nonomuraea africana]|uniref:TRAP transporter TAXI family solute receptor n=1 Tax=Nonomuraea africana TaxID=46171 RepID=A0ABR9KJZ5_9ACTN|nr:TAXI family TRAP transporter solute-binding subunit [Nonomuraea africana]MBE1562343.1 TRAP transporter TAXI family solute receptor [Nonomuraea africana]
MPSTRRAFLAMASGLAAGCVAGCATGSDAPAELRFATGPSGGPYEVLGARLATELRRRGFAVRVVRTAASIENLAMLADGRADLGLSLADSADEAVRVRRTRVSALARMYMNYVHLVVRTDSGIQRIEDLAGRAVSIGAEGSGTAFTAERVLAKAPIGEPARTFRLGLDESLATLAAGGVDAFFWSGGVPTPALARARRSIRLLPLDSLVAPLRRAYGPLYESAIVPAEEYELPGPVPTIGTPSYLVCRMGLPGDVAFSVTETVFASRDRLEAPDAPGGRLDRRYAIGTGAVPLHEGAVRYYRSVYG